MELFRLEVDVQTGVTLKIFQYAYRNEDEVLVLDFDDEPPIGYMRFIPE